MVCDASLSIVYFSSFVSIPNEIDKFFTNGIFLPMKVYTKRNIKRRKIQAWVKCILCHNNVVHLIDAMFRVHPKCSPPKLTVQWWLTDPWMEDRRNPGLYNQPIDAIWFSVVHRNPLRGFSIKQKWRETVCQSATSAASFQELFYWLKKLWNKV